MNYAKNSPSVNIQSTINMLWWILKIAYGLFLIVVGVDKFFWIITPWGKYVSTTALNLLNAVTSNIFVLNASTILYGVGVVEILVGLMILTKFTRIGCYLAIAWILIVVANLFMMGRLYVDIAARDLLIAVGVYALIRLTDLHEQIFTE